jgi:hypothetical protein
MHLVHFLLFNCNKLSKVFDVCLNVKHSLNHPTQKQTRDYLCIQQEELKQLYAFEI